MAQYRLGHETTKHRRQTNVVIPVSVKTQVYTRLKAMRDSLQEELGPDQYVTLASIVRRILYQHPALRKAAMRHSAPEADGGDSMGR
jgi:hypothetical protein